MITGEFATGSDCTSPTVSTNSAESQHEVEGSLGFRTYHQLESSFLPMISACLPITNAPTMVYEIPGPKRQLTGWSFAEARKTLGVEVGVLIRSSTLSSVSVMTGVEIELLDVGVSSTGVGVDVGTPVG
jgi:hypothetical protein